MCRTSPELLNLITFTFSLLTPFPSNSFDLYFLFYKTNKKFVYVQDQLLPIPVRSIPAKMTTFTVSKMMLISWVTPPQKLSPFWAWKLYSNWFDGSKLGSSPGQRLRSGQGWWSSLLWIEDRQWRVNEINYLCGRKNFRINFRS